MTISEFLQMTAAWWQCGSHSALCGHWCGSLVTARGHHGRSL